MNPPISFRAALLLRLVAEGEKILEKVTQVNYICSTFSALNNPHITQAYSKGTLQ